MQIWLVIKHNVIHLSTKHSVFWEYNFCWYKKSPYIIIVYEDDLFSICNKTVYVMEITISTPTLTPTMLYGLLCSCESSSC